MITVTAKFKVKPDKTEEFKKRAIDVTRETKKEKGCLSYTVYNAVKSKTEFIFIEDWLNDTAIEEHNIAAHFTGFLDNVRPLLEAEPEITRLKKIPSVFF